MINYTTKYVNTISLIISIIVFFLLNNLYLKIKEFDFKTISIFNQFQQNVQILDDNKNSVGTQTKEFQYVSNDNNDVKKSLDVDWKIIIPSIELEAKIAEGTTKEIMDKYVGHFDDMSRTTGNVGLAAHNRGYPVNYFENLKKLKEGDVIIYQYKNFKMEYIVNKTEIIKDTDWSRLEDIEEKNIITLITCVENEPEYRRCIQGLEKKGK